MTPFQADKNLNLLQFPGSDDSDKGEMGCVCLNCGGISLGFHLFLMYFC